MGAANKPNKKAMRQVVSPTLGGNKPPKHRDGDDELKWRQVPSNYPNNPPLWVGE
jgi:hypothetical protein